VSRPRYSVLLPTRNGADVLEASIASVLDQAYEDFELVISDNASEDATPEIVARYASHPRVRVVRAERPLDISDSWSAVLAASSGERLMLLGDDDALLPRYFERADALLERHGDPDVLFYNAYCFAHPGFAGSRVPHYQEAFYQPVAPVPAEGELSLGLRRSLIADLFRFDFRIALNVQTVLVARSALERLPSGLFPPPFPDVYGVAALLLTAPRFAISPERLLVLGVPPKSIAHAYLADDFEDRMRNYLGVHLDFEGMLPGSLMSGNYVTFHKLKRDFPSELAGVEVDRRRYVLQQTYSWYVLWRQGVLGRRDVARRLRLLSARDWIGLAQVGAGLLRPASLRRHLRVTGEEATTTVFPTMQPLPGISDIAEFSAWVEAGQPRPLATA
jgi:glycosyltransferase involved in cell wall biosynthesis